MSIIIDTGMIMAGGRVALLGEHCSPVLRAPAQGCGGDTVPRSVGAGAAATPPVAPSRFAHYLTAASGRGSLAVLGLAMDGVQRRLRSSRA